MLKSGFNPSKLADRFVQALSTDPGPVCVLFFLISATWWSIWIYLSYFIFKCHLSVWGQVIHWILTFMSSDYTPASQMSCTSLNRDKCWASAKAPLETVAKLNLFVNVIGTISSQKNQTRPTDANFLGRSGRIQWYGTNHECARCNIVWEIYRRCMVFEAQVIFDAAWEWSDVTRFIWVWVKTPLKSAEEN